MLQKTMVAVVLLLSSLAAAHVGAEEISLDLFGKGGFGLLPENEVGANTPGVGDSTATGGETGAGFVYDTVTMELSFSFEFSGLSQGLFDAASGIHLHNASPGVDPINETGGIVFNLNSGADPNVILSTPTVAIGATSGNLAGVATLDATQESDLLAGRYYLNIHSGGFTGGELRGNLVPEPTSFALLATVFMAAAIRRRR